MVQFNAQTEYLAIQHVPSGKFLPDAPAKGKFTHVEPVAPWIAPPRLFANEKAATLALTWWLKGRIQAVYSLEHGDPIGMQVTPVASRVPGEYQIVPVELHWKTTNTNSPTNRAARKVNHG